MRANGIVVAIDGPAGAGKSTTARAVAAALGYLYLDTGAMYRAVALGILDAGVDPDDAEAAEQAACGVRIEQVPDPTGTRTLVDGVDVSGRIRAPEVSDAASRVAVHPGVRKVLVDRQQAIGQAGGIVLEGRDTTTAIFPDAELKVFLEATVEARVARRRAELNAAGAMPDPEALMAEIEARDARDRKTQTRNGPWPPDDAVRVDTTGLTIDEQVARIVDLAVAAGARAEAST